MITLSKLVLSAAVVVLTSAIATSALAQGDSWDTGPGTVATPVADPGAGAGARPNGVNTGVATLAPDGTIVNLNEPTGGVSDFIYAFQGTIWFLSDTDGVTLLLPAQLNGITLTTTDITEDGTFQPMVRKDPTTGAMVDVFGTPFRVQSDLDPVPEPQTWLTLIVGFAGLGAVLRRRRAHAA